jgi:multiple sugar transport system ATP-binding protein
MAAVAFKGVGKVYSGGHRAVEDLTLDIVDGEFMVLVGPSGCGKTTALRMVAGLEEITEGEIEIAGDVVNFLEPRRRDVAMVFQNYALYPHMTVFENLAFPLRARKVTKQETETRVTRTAELLGLNDMLNRRPGTLSGGQRQRVAMGRAIVREPRLFLMDEPLSNLDAKLRSQMRAEIAELQRHLGTTTIYVTHDQVEAMTMADRIAIMRKGRLQQVGSPQALYDRPANLFVATFIGGPAMNLVRARLEQDSNGLSCVVGATRLPIPTDHGIPGSPLAAYVGREVAVGIRPERLSEVAEGSVDGSLVGDVTLVETLGFEQLVHVKIAAQPVLTEEVLEVVRDTDVVLADTLQAPESEGHVVLIARLVNRTSVRVRDRVHLAIDGRNLQLFALDTGDAIG